MGDFQTKELLSLGELENLAPIFRGKVGNALARGLMRMLSIDRINGIYARNYGLVGPDFASAVLSDAGFEYRICREDETSDLSDLLPQGPFITISNHPCGHLDGISLVDIFGHLRPDYKVMVNRILSRIKPLEDSFITVTPTGKDRLPPTGASVKGVKEALCHLRDGGALGLFPSGAVSDLSLKDGYIRDREWQESVVRLIMKAKVPVLPVRFFDGNSMFYYSLGLLDWRIRLLRLPAEVFNKKGSVMRIGIGPLISVEEQQRFGKDVGAFRDFLRHSVYDLTPSCQTEHQHIR